MSKSLDKNGQHKTLMITSAIIGIVALIVIAVAVIFSLRDKVSNPVVLNVGGTAIHKDTYDSLVTQGKKYKVSDNNVRSIIIDYYKNKIAAKDLNISVDIKYPQESRGHMVNQNLMNQQNYDYLALSESSDEIAHMMIYNTAFDIRMQSIQSGGHTLVVFDFPAAPNPFETEDVRKAAVKKDAENLRKRIISGDISGDKALKEASRINSNAGRNSLSGAYFIPADTTQGAGVSGTGILTYGFLAEYVKTLKSTGISEVSVVQDDNYFFVDYLHNDKADSGIVDKVTSIKNKVRVVEYDK